MSLGARNLTISPSASTKPMHLPMRNLPDLQINLQMMIVLILQINVQMRDIQSLVQVNSRIDGQRSEHESLQRKT